MLGHKIIQGETARRVSGYSGTIWLITTIIGMFLTWATYAQLDEIVRGRGKIVPTMKNQIIQNLEGGIMKEIFVTEGELVTEGQIIALLDDTRFQSAYLELREQQWALSLRLHRLKAEVDHSTDFFPNPQLEKLAPEYASSERQQFIARKKELEGNVSQIQEALALKIQEAEILRRMVEQSAVPRIELIRAERDIVETEMRLNTIQFEFETKRAKEYAETLIKLRQLEEQLRGREDQLFRTTVRSPINGVVNKVLATTIGGVIQPGDPIVEVLSREGKLRVEGRIEPKDIGFVYVGMPATVKLTAFDFSIYGVLNGTVVHVGADTVLDETQRDTAPYYEVFISLDNYSLTGPYGTVDVKPGMQAQIELYSGQKTVLQYILKPLFKTTEAFTER